jgi:predicted nucleotidyltransferase
VSEEVVVVRAPARFTLEEVAGLARPALETAGAERAIVFGSWARGTEDGYSDLDLAVVLEPTCRGWSADPCSRTC